MEHCFEEYVSMLFGFEAGTGEGYYAYTAEEVFFQVELAGLGAVLFDRLENLNGLGVRKRSIE